MATEYDTSRFQYELYRYAYENGHEQWITTAKKAFDFWRGKQWDPRTVAQLNREGRPAMTFNVIESLVRSMKGIQRALRNDVRFTPFQNASLEDARVMDAVWLHTQQQNQLDFLETDVYEKGLIMGRGYYDVRVSYDDSFQGNVVLRGRRSQDIVLDPSVDEYDPDTWPRVFDRRWVSYDDLVRLYGDEKARAVGLRPLPEWFDYEDAFMAQQMGDMPYYASPDAQNGRSIRGYLLLGQQYFVYKRKDVFVDMRTGDTSEIPESWDRNRVAHVLDTAGGMNVIKRDVKTVRWTVSCENTVMHDDDSPYKHFTIVPFFPTFVDGVTMGAVEHLIDPQQLFNKTTSQEQHILNGTANSGYKVKAGSLKNMTEQQLEERGSKTGFVAVLEDTTHLERLSPNPLPQGHDRLSFKADQIMRNLSGVSNQSRGFAREDVASEAILANQAAQDVNFAGWLSNLHRSKQLLASRVRDCVQAHYTETRVIQINRGSVLNPEMENVTLNQPSAEGGMLNDVTQGRYTTALVPAPSRVTMSEADFKLVLEMRKLGIGIPDALLIELSPMTNKAQVLQSMQGDSNERQRQAEEQQAQAQALEQEKIIAQAQKEQAAAMLNQARAQKFAIEAQTDPDAAYERVESARIDAERDRDMQKQAFEREKFEHEKQHDSRELAIKLTQIDAQREASMRQAESKADSNGGRKPPKAKRPERQK